MLAVGWFLRVTLRKVDWQKDFHRQRWVIARKPFFQTQQGRCTDELAMAVTAGTAVCKFKPDQLPAWAGE